MRVSVIVGLPGSGKTTLLREFEARGAVVVDDIRRTADMPVNRVPWLAVTHPSLCREVDRRTLVAALDRKYGPVEIEWTFFENDPEACARNAAARDDGREVGPDIAAFSKAYAIPDDADTLPIPGDRSRRMA